MTSISKNVYINKLDDIFDKYNNTYYRTIKVKLVNVKPSTYIDSSKEINDKDANIKIGDIVRISKYKNIFAEGLLPNYSEENFVIKKVTNIVLWTFVVGDFKLLKVLERFTKKNCKKSNQK